jgi:hypothetical protein
VTVSLANPDKKESPYQLWLVSVEEWCVEMKKFNLPLEPEIKNGYVRWIFADRKTGNYVVATGDNEKAVVLKFDVSSRYNFVIYLKFIPKSTLKPEIYTVKSSICKFTNRKIMQ